MLKIYLQTKTKLGYLYFPYNGGKIECHNFIKDFDDQFKMKSYITQLRLDTIKFQMDAFVSCYKANNNPSTDVDSKSFDTLYRLNEWMNDGDKELEKIYKQIGKRKEEFISLIKSAKNKKDDLIMIYKLMFEEIKTNE